MGRDSEEELSGAESEVREEFVCKQSVFEPLADSEFEHGNTLSDQEIITTHDKQ